MGKRLLILSTVFPGCDSGSALALRSSLAVYNKYFEHCHYVAILNANKSDIARKEFPGVCFRSLEVERPPIAARFLKSLWSGFPACVMQYLDASKISAVQSIIREFRNEGGTHVIFEHVAPAVLLLRLEREFLGLRVALRSHDVLAHAFRLLSSNKKGLQRLAWRFEADRVRKLEHQLANQVEYLWCISEEDAGDYACAYGVRPRGTIGVTIDSERYLECRPGVANRVIHLGGSDARKEDGIRWLVDCVWPIVRSKNSLAELHLGGIGSESFAKPDLGIFSHGPVDDDLAFLEVGVVFVNPQRAGSGIKMKSLSALAAGRILVTTSNGCRGIPGVPGYDYFVADGTHTMADMIVTALANYSNLRCVGVRAQHLIKRCYSWQKFEESALPLIKDFADN